MQTHYHSQTPSLALVAQRLTSLVFSLSVLATWGCDTGKISISELSFPQVSSDPVGPYMISARTSGPVDELRVEWYTEAPAEAPEEARLDEELNRQGMTLATFDGERWTARLPGVGGLVDYHFSLIASNSTHEARYPSQGAAFFKVRALNGSCSSDSQCLPGEICHRSEGYCFSPPEPCTLDLHCPRDQFCNPDTGACRFYDSACESAEDCASGYQCQEGSCVLPCDGRCGGGYICEGISCVAPPCEGSSDCPLELPLCDEGRCAPAPSSCEPACGANERCVLGSCEPAPCGDGPACSNGSVCVEGQCIGCQADGQCGEGRRCDLNTSTCVEGARARLCAPCHEAIDGELGCGDTLTCVDTYPGCRLTCRSDDDCPDGYCLDGGCLQYDYELCEGYSCTADSDCSGERVCVAGFCLEGQRCEADADCARDMRCGEGGLCTLRSPCEYTYGPRCGSGEVCVGGRCEAAREPSPNLCVPCSSDLDCGPQQVCGFFYEGAAFCATLCDTRCDDGLICEPFSELVSACVTEYGSTCGVYEECGWDQWEPNNDIESASFISFNTSYFDGWVCSSEQDWFFLDDHLNSSKFVTGADSFGDVVLELFDVDYNNMGTVIPDIDFSTPLPDGVQWILATSYSPYDVYYWFELNPLAQCSGDIFEPNDEPWEAYPVGLGAELDLRMCPNDSDWFELNLSPDMRPFTVSLERFNGLNAFWYLGLFNQNGDLLNDAVTDTQTLTQLSYLQEREEPLYLQIQCLDGCFQEFDYRLSIEQAEP